MAKPIYNENIQIEGKETKIEIFKYDPKITMAYKSAKTIAFVDEDNICIFIDNNDHPSLPGGKLEQKETPEQALNREVKEEINANVIHSTPLAVIRYHFLITGRIDCMLIYKSKVSLLEGDLNDPDGDVKNRLIIPKDQLIETFHNSSHIQVLYSLLD